LIIYRNHLSLSLSLPLSLFLWLKSVHSVQRTLAFTSFLIFKKVIPQSVVHTHLYPWLSLIDNVGMQDACVMMSHLGIIKWLLKMVRCHHQYVLVRWLGQSTDSLTMFRGWCSWLSYFDIAMWSNHSKLMKKDVFQQLGLK
jgi:hypothetical protein